MLDSVSISLQFDTRLRTISITLRLDTRIWQTMDGQIVDVEYEDGQVEIVKIVEDTQEQFVVTPLVQTSTGFFRFSNQFHTIPKESVSGFYDTKELEDTGLFTKINDIFYESTETSDSDYEYSSDDESDTESEVSLDSE